MRIDVKRGLLIELVLVLVLSIATPIIALWKVFPHVGYIYQRDSYPYFYLDSRQSAILSLGFPAIMDNVWMPIVVMLYFNLISPVIADCVSYFLYPFALSIPSMYFASRYFLNRYAKETKNEVRIGVSAVIAFLYAITPTAYYYSHWSDYAAFYALLPALIAGAFYAFEKGEFLGALLLSVFASLTTTDPRGFVYTLFIIFSVLIYRHKLSDLKVFLYSISLYLLLNSRLFIILFYNFHSYSSISFSISNQQLWLNYLTFPLLDSLRGLSLFRPLVSYLSFGNPFLIYVMSFAFVETGILGYIFLKKKGSVANYFLAIYVFLVLLVSSNVNILGYSFTLNLTYPLLNFLAQTFVYNYLWIFLPTYLTEMIIAPLFLLVSLVMAKILLSKHYLIPLVILIVLSQFAFSSSMVISGNYLGEYNPVNPTPLLLSLAQFLENHTIGNVVVSAVVPANWSTFIGVLPNVTSVPLLNTSNIGIILNDFGVQYVVTSVNDNYTLSIINSHRDVFSLVYNNSYFLVFRNNDFTYNIYSPIYVNFEYPEVPLTNRSLNVIPSYLMFEIPPRYIGGYVGNVTYAELLALSSYKQGIYPVELNLKHLPYPTNFTNTINVNVYDEEILSEFPDISFISVSNTSSLNLNVKSGLYKVILIYISIPGGGVFGISNGSYSLSVSTSSPNISVEFSYLGNILVSNNSTKLFFNGDSLSYLLAVMFIPYNMTTLHEFNGDSISSYPSPQLGRSFGYAYNDADVVYFSIIINLVTLLIFIILFVSLKHDRTYFRKINLKIFRHK
ncbi:hypothetical protein GFS03_01295 [Sulfolobus sp. E5-1-F]|uniref:hypothetical protein n=1 Tax=Sulfolobaceae TaxID=118883 RepID=UPI00129723F6|nr:MULTISPECIES: hypothetical protein [unclassified Sulfolobus]QGA53322.1 hypothetical protein GFS03_01295 [Sulfolobus sp. E5-1-F]QGA68432.1 hypothetical protein GFS33_06495 [Sulfolobus sp. E11-6]